VQDSVDTAAAAGVAGAAVDAADADDAADAADAVNAADVADAVAVADVVDAADAADDAAGSSSVVGMMTGTSVYVSTICSGDVFANAARCLRNDSLVTVLNGPFPAFHNCT
jgi:hypothetical protein